LGAFYPFSRNHNDINSDSQEPYLFEGDFGKAIKEAMILRYKLHAYLYSLVHMAS